MVVFWRSLHSGRNRLLAALLTAISFSLLLLLSTQASAPTQDIPADPRPLPPSVRVDGLPAQPRLVIEGRTVLSGEGMHLGRPQLSPDGQRIAVDVIPSGNETAHLAQIHVYALDGELVGELVDQLPGHSPRWVDDEQLSFETSTARGQYDLSSRRASFEPVSAPAPHTIPPGDWPVQYPATIRVAHHPSNACRPGVADWQVDVIPF